MNRAIKGSWSLVIGLWMTFLRLFERANTVQYPDEMLQMPTGAKGQLFNNIDDCIGCGLCSRACPVDCIAIEAVKRSKDEEVPKASNGMKLNFHMLRFDIDMAKCCYCDLCAVACPTDCLYMTPSFENSAYSRHDFIYHFHKMPAEEVATMKAEAKKVVMYGIHE